MTSAPKSLLRRGNSAASTTDDSVSNETSAESPFAMTRSRGGAAVCPKAHGAGFDRLGSAVQGRRSPTMEKDKHVEFNLGATMGRAGFSAMDQEVAINDHNLTQSADGASASVSCWSCSQVQRWLTAIGFSNLVQKFEDEAIDGEALLELLEEDLVLLGISRLGDRKRLMKHVRLLQADQAELSISSGGGGGRGGEARGGCGGRRPPELDDSRMDAHRATDAWNHGQRHGEGADIDAGHENFGHLERHSSDKRDGPPSACRRRSPEPSSNDASPDNPLAFGYNMGSDQTGGSSARSASTSKGRASSPGASSNEPSPDNPLVPSNSGRTRRERSASTQNTVNGTSDKNTKKKSSKNDGDSNANVTSPDNPLAFGHYWGKQRGLPERPAVMGSFKDRSTWHDDPGPR